MALAKQNVSLSFSDGVDTKTDDKQVVPGKMLTLENAIFVSPKKFTKRNGYNNLGLLSETGPSPISSATALATFKDELNLFSGTELYSYAAGLFKYSDKGRYISLEVTSEPIIRNTAIQTSPDSAIHAEGLTGYTWEDSRGGVRYSIVDDATGEYVVQDAVVLTTAQRPKMFAVGQHFVILYVNTVDGQLYRKAINVLTPSTISAPVLLSLDMNADHNYDATPISERLFVAFDTAQAGGSIKLFYIDSFLVQSLFTDVVGENAAEAIGLFGDTLQQVWVAYANGVNIKGFVYNYDLDVQIRPPTAGEAQSGIRNIAGAVVPQSVQGQLYFEKSAALPLNTSIRNQPFSVAGGMGAASRFMGGVGLASDARAYENRLYFLTVHDSPLQPTYFLLNDLGDVVAKAAPGIAGGLTARTSTLPELVGPALGAFTVATLEKDLVLPATTAPLNLYTQTGVVSVKLDFLSNNTFLSMELAQNLHLTGGFVSMYDGISAVEHGFHLYPENVSVAVSPAGGLIGAGTYQYFVTYEWMDNQGNVHRSAPSIGVSVTNVGATSSNTVTVSTLRLTAKKAPLRTPVSVVFYRTAANQLQPYRISPLTALIQNDPTVDTISFIDTLNDSAIVGNETLYTFGGVVDNIAAPATRSLFTYNNRLIAIPSELSTSFWFSKEILPRTPAEFSDLFVQNVDPRGGGLTGGIQLDDKMILFRKPSVSYVVGQGPTATGAGNDFSDAQIITTDVGCTNQRSIVAMPVGIMFKSAKGIYLLDRSLAVQYIGAPVEAFNDLLITSARLMASKNQVRFTTVEGTTMVFDYLMNQWSVFTPQMAVDAVVFRDVHTYVQANGLALQETPGLFTDNGQQIKVRLVTSWLSLAGLQGFQRIYRLMVLGEYKSLHKLLIKVAYDFNPAFTQETLINAGALLAGVPYGGDPFFGDSTVWGGGGTEGFPRYQFELHLTRQKCEAIQFSIEDVQVPPFGESMTLSALALQVGTKQGLNKRPAARKFA